ncbi:hypothetical protein PHLCEN_2v12088 [Hermanssonia centrifuga]|uniref:Uncharacterized protein n=1 Tax=Hermanssonia centrifuga TaxID=98765 RepID=A0A2R6NIH2_9APHY|nr:hypothetical protein PHLCEN_2v12088 [Hermanssonia centrifuga]
MGYISRNALDNLKKYAYKGVDKSLLSRFVLTPFWNWLVTLWPTWVAPNVITMCGLCMVLINFATLLYYDPTYLAEKGGATGPPRWIYFTLVSHEPILDGLEVVLCCQALNLGRSWWTVASQIATLANFYLTTWEEYHTGQLYLGVFSGPVEGIIMICGIFVITGLYGDYINVFKARITEGQNPFSPLLGLTPFPISVALQLFWLSSPDVSRSAIINSPLFIPFLCAWGLQFAHQVGKMILAHVTKQPFPWGDPLWLWSLLGALDANMPLLFNRPPLIQHSPHNMGVVVYLTLAISVYSYARFCTLVINDITDYLGIACFTVRKRDTVGVWRRAASVDKAMNTKKQ